MLTKIDWISFSVPVSPVAHESYTLTAVADALHLLHPDLSQWLALEAGTEGRNGRAPYRISWHTKEAGVTVFCHPSLTHALIEISGRGCDFLTDNGHLNDVLTAVQERVTRIDIACDMQSETRPGEFVVGRDAKRFKAQSHVISESGETFYVGARSSNRYARVYRYNAPHERSHLLRCEYVLKAEDAKILASTLQTERLSSVVATLGQTFGWKHADWNVTEEPAEMIAYRPDRREGKTLYWLSDTIAPLLVRLHREGVINVETWIAENVLTKV